MMKHSRWIAARFAPGFEQKENLHARMRIGLLEGWVSLMVNNLLGGLKLWLGLLTGSIALLADVAHTFSDSLTSIVVIFGFRVSRKPADEEHPFGHGRMESIAALVIAVLLAVVAFEAFMAAVDRLIHPKPVHAANWVIAVIVVSIFLKEWLARFCFDLGYLIDSRAIYADAWHSRSDVYATALVVVAFIGAHWNLWWLDGAMGIGVAGLIGWAAFQTLKGAAGPLLGERAPEKMYKEIEQIARSVPGVQGVHDILVNSYGGTNIVSLHIEVPASESALRLHEISSEIEDRVARRFPGHAIVHVDPLNSDHEHYETVRQIVEEVMAEAEGITSFHDLRLLGSGERLKVVFDVATEAGVGESETRDLRRKIEKRLREEFPRARVVIDVEPPYFRNVPERRRDPVAEDSGPE